MEVGKLPAVGLSEGGHTVRSILGISLDVVRGDGDGGDPFRGDLKGKTAEGVGEMDDVGAVIASKDNEETALFSDEGGGTMEKAGRVGQDEVRRDRAGLKSEGGGHCGHDDQAVCGERVGEIAQGGLTF
jgi:hypothetical protein